MSAAPNNIVSSPTENPFIPRSPPRGKRGDRRERLEGATWDRACKRSSIHFKEEGPSGGEEEEASQYSRTLHKKKNAASHKKGYRGKLKHECEAPKS